MIRMEAEVRLKIITDVHCKQSRQEGEGWETGRIGQGEREDRKRRERGGEERRRKERTEMGGIEGRERRRIRQGVGMFLPMTSGAK
jgi:hypothetical protein